MPSPNFPLKTPTKTTSSSYYTSLLRTHSVVLSQSLTHVKQLHVHLLKSPHYKPSLILLNNLLTLYSKCHDPKSAHKLFVKMPSRDSTSYNTLISAFSRSNLHSKALHLFIDARYAPVRLDAFTYTSVLSLCSRTSNLTAGRVLHTLTLVSGLSSSLFVVNSLIHMYAACGNLAQARLVFETATELDLVSWNSLISGTETAGSPEEVLRVFLAMQRAGVELNSFAVASVLKSCSSSNELAEFGESVHTCVVKAGLEYDVNVAGAMLDMYAKNGLICEAVEVFSLVTHRNVIVYNALIAGLSAVSVEALCLFSEMQREGIRPSKFTFSSILKACKLNQAFEFGKQIHGQVIKAKLQADEFISSALIDLYSTALSMDDAFRCFNSVPKPDAVIWTSMISGCVKSENFEKAISLFREFLASGRRIELFTVSSAMSACANLGVARSGEQIQSYSIKSGFYKHRIWGNSQIDMYARSGDIDAASRTFQEVENHDVVTWSAMIGGHALHGCARDALRVFEEMKDCGVEPNHVTFVGVLTACSHGGLVDEGLRYFKSMKRDYNIDPNAKHTACIADLLARAGRLAEAEHFILYSGFNNDPIIWRALLGSCRIHRDINSGARVAARIMELDPGAPASYVLLHNLYLDSGNKPLAMKIRHLMRKRGVMKEPGVSWISIRESVHSFVTGDKSHAQSRAIYSKLDELLSKIETFEGKEDLVNCHSEMLALTLGMICLPALAPILVMKNYRTCRNCHATMKLISEIERREIVMRDLSRFHHFRGGACSCSDNW